MFLKQELVATEGQVRECSQGILTQMENSITAFIVQMERIISSMQPVKPHCKDAFTEADLNEKLEESFTMVFFPDRFFIFNLLIIHFLYVQSFWYKLLLVSIHQ